VELERCDWRQVNRFVVDYLRRDGLLLRCHCMLIHHQSIKQSVSQSVSQAVNQ